MEAIKKKLIYVRDTVEDVSVLLVESDDVVRPKVVNVLDKVFSHHIAVRNSTEGLEAYKIHRSHIVITDIGNQSKEIFAMISAMKKINPFVKILIVSKSEKPEDFIQAIDAGVFRYMMKPLKLKCLSDALHDIVVCMEIEENRLLFYRQSNELFNYENQLIFMLKDNLPILANKNFLDFMGNESVESLLETIPNIECILQKHNSFLYSRPGFSWLEEAVNKEGKLFHTKIFNLDGVARHMILRLQKLPKKHKQYMVSLNDITELDLLSLFDKEAQGVSNKSRNDVSIEKLMRVVFDNQGELKLFNFYKGLAIVNKAKLVKINSHDVVIKTTYSQLKIIEMSQSTTIQSELFPSDVVAQSIKSIDYKHSTVTLCKVSFLANSAAVRECLRLDGDIEDKVTLFYHESKFPGRTTLVNLSPESLKMEIDALPVGMKKGDKLKISLVLSASKKPLSLTFEAEILKLYEKGKRVNLILMFKLSSAHTTLLTEYLQLKQLDLIREFKRIG